MNEGLGLWWAAVSGGRPKEPACGAVSGILGVVLGPSCPEELAACPAVMTPRLYFFGDMVPGLGKLETPGFASLNALWASMRKSWIIPWSECFRMTAACQACWASIASSRDFPVAAARALRCHSSSSMEEKSASGKYLATSSGPNAGQVM